MNRFTIRCTEEQTKKALQLGAPIKWTLVEGNQLQPNYPTAEEMLGWMRGKGIKFHFDDETNYWRVSNELEPISISYGNSPKKELSAIDAVLEYMGKQNDYE